MRADARCGPRPAAYVSFGPPDPPLADDVIRLAPLASEHDAGLEALALDGDVRRFTYVPSDPPPGFASGWRGRYEEGWRDGTRAGFAIESLDGELLGFAAFVRLDLADRQGEIGYIVAPPARGRGVATRMLRLLTEWGFGELGLERIELRIDVENAASERVAERAGYTREGVLRSVAFKEGLRADIAIWSCLRGDRG
jgi:RimJ/RimL family protein N-acetyltransferase